MATIAYIVANSGSLSATRETPFKDRMESTLGHTVTLITDNDAESTDFSSYDAIVSSYQCQPGNIDGLKETVKPMMFSRYNVTDEYAFGDSGSTAGGLTAIKITDITHYITQNEDLGDLTIYGGADYIVYFKNWANDVDDLATHTSLSDRCHLAEIDKDETLADESTAAERRVMWGPIEGDRLNADGWALFDRAIGWILYDDAADSGSADLSANVTIQNQGQYDLSANFQIAAQTGSADLSANVTIQNKSQVDLSSNVTIQNKAQTDLSANVTIQNKSQVDLSSNVTIQNKGQQDLRANVTIQNIGQSDLSSNVTIQNKSQADLSANFTIVSGIQSGQYDLSANFTIATDHGYITLADALVHNIPIASQTHTIELSNSIHNIVVTAATHAIELSDQTHCIVISSEPLK